MAMQPNLGQSNELCQIAGEGGVQRTGGRLQPARVDGQRVRSVVGHDDGRSLKRLPKCPFEPVPRPLVILKCMRRAELSFLSVDPEVIGDRHLRGLLRLALGEEACRQPVVGPKRRAEEANARELFTMQLMPATETREVCALVVQAMTLVPEAAARSSARVADQLRP